MDSLADVHDYSGLGLESVSSSKIFVGNLPFSVSKDRLGNLFSPFGTVRGINLRTDRNTGRAKGFGFITFTSPEEATNAIEAMNGYVLDGRQLSVNRATNRGEKSGMGSTVKCERIWEMSSPLGKKSNQQQKSWTSWTGMSTESSTGSKDEHRSGIANSIKAQLSNSDRSCTNFNIAIATENDYEKIFELINESYEVENGDSGIAFKKTPRLLSWDDSGMKEAYEKNRVLVARIRGNDEIVGVIAYHIPEDGETTNNKSIHFGPLAVSPKHQKKGIALRLIREVESIGLEANCEYVEISVVNFRTDILPWYKRIGFEVIEEGQPFPDPERCTRACTFVILRMKLFQFSN